MAISRRFPIPFEGVFPYGAYLVSEVSAVVDYDKSSKERKVQSIDLDTGLPLWSVEVLDADPDAKKSSRTVSVMIPGKVQPVPPGNETELPFTPVAFEGMTALPWIEESGSFSRISWSLRATSIVERRPIAVPRPSSKSTPAA